MALFFRYILCFSALLMLNFWAIRFSQFDDLTIFSLVTMFTMLGALIVLGWPNEKSVWKSAVQSPPNLSGRYWCYVEEINDISISHYQSNCYYNKEDNVWSEDRKTVKVLHWTYLLDNPK